ncbi:MAG: RNB domain-containing ribonuclease [Marmoricola sp.]
MSGRVLRVGKGEHDELRRRIAAIQAEQQVTADFPAEVEAAAARSAEQVRLPDLDRTDIAFVTIDPPESRDLDQALHIERDGDGYVVHYAIADLAAFITPGDPVDLEANRRGESLYGADSKIPLHPTSLSEGAASLLPDEDRPALLWTVRLDRAGEGVDARVERARVRSRAKLDYESCQRRIDDGSADDVLQLLREVGQLRSEREVERGGVDLPVPEQEVQVDGPSWRLEFRKMLPVEAWNAQISLLTGFAAASMMVYGRVGILRTLPPPEPEAVKRLHRTAKALGVDWPAEQLYPDFIRSLDPATPSGAAVVMACTSLLRGAGYVGFDGEVPAEPEHAALASEYAHVTAPLRRLVDRYALEVCVALTDGTTVPDWVLAKLEEVPATMQHSAQRAHAYERAVLDLVEAETLKGRVGESFTGVVVESEHDHPDRGVVTVRDLAVEAPVAATSGDPLPVGEEVTVRLAEADPASRTVRFEL